MSNNHNIWLSAWYGKSRWTYCLIPLAWLFILVSVLRRFLLTRFFQSPLSVPVIVVGNISVGGTGKTPLIIELVKYLQAQGYTPGVISRGYGGKPECYPYVLSEISTADQSGDEPLLIYQATHCLVCVAPDRTAAAQRLIEQGCNLLLSDDGLQHYRLARSMEIALVDGQRLFGNGWRLPVGPLRESISRLREVDFIVINQTSATIPAPIPSGHFDMQIQPVSCYQVSTGESFSLSQLHSFSNWQAVAAIGNPERFFKTLDGLSLAYESHTFPDHHAFSPTDFKGWQQEPVIMTEKDAVKCRAFSGEHWYALTISAQLPEAFWQRFQQKIDYITRH